MTGGRTPRFDLVLSVRQDQSGGSDSADPLVPVRTGPEIAQSRRKPRRFALAPRDLRW